MQLTGASPAFAGGVEVQNGGIIFGATGAVLGTGTLNLNPTLPATSVSLIAAVAPTFTNAVIINGNVDVGGILAITQTTGRRDPHFQPDDQCHSSPAGHVYPSAASLAKPAGSRGLTKTGLGTLTLNNASNTFTGKTTISNGTLSIIGARTASVRIPSASRPTN